MELRLVTVDGVERDLEPTRKSIFETLRSFDPAVHRRLLLRNDLVQATAWPRRHAANALGTACLRVVLDGETRWLGRAAGPLTFDIEGTTMPSTVEVPVVWISGALDQLVRSPQWPALLPWHGGAPLHPLGRWRGDAYSFAQFEGAPDPTPLLHALGVELLEYLSTDQAFAVYSGAAAAREVIAELRRVGHDLWSLDCDGDVELWGSDYIRDAEGAGLQLSLAPGWVGELAFRQFSADPRDEDE